MKYSGIVKKIKLHGNYTRIEPWNILIMIASELVKREFMRLNENQ